MAPKEIPRGPLLTTFKNLVNKIIRVYLSVQPKDTVSKKKEFKYITELVFFIQSQDVNIVNRCLKHMEQVVRFWTNAKISSHLFESLYFIFQFVNTYVDEDK